MKHLGLLALLALSVGPVAPAQQPTESQAREEAAFRKRAVSTLLGFASFARSKKVHTREKQAYDLIVASYDPDHASARRKLGFRKVQGVWEPGPPAKRPEWIDRANDRQRYDVVDRWYKTAQAMARLHRERGLELFHDETGANVGLGAHHLRQAILFDPFDEKAHTELGHEEEGGYFGSRAELDFIKSLKAIETTALMLAKKDDYPVEPVAEIPQELAELGLEFHGARSKHFTIFTRGTQKNADDCALWAERALDFFVHCVGEKRGTVMRGVFKQGLAWVGFVWTAKEMERFLEVNPTRGQLLEDGTPPLNVGWGTPKGGVVVARQLTPASMHDWLIALIFRRALGGTNDPLLEGTMHAATWFLKSTCITRFGESPKGTVGEAEKPLPEGANWWMREMRDQATAGTDMPINAVPRVPFWKFSSDARLKSWSFMTWLIARYPHKWVDFLLAVPGEKLPFPKEVDDAAAKVFERPLDEIEDEWRDWASGRGVTAAATGYGPPLLPEQPNQEEIDGLARLNALRGLAKVPVEPGDKTTGEPPGLPVCDLDAEASAACQRHAEFLGLHPDHHKWPEAHEEDPAKQGFSPQGMRAGLRSVIVWTAAGGGLDAADSIDLWIGTVYHRFPLLQYNIDRIGFAYAEGPEADVIVLDMGSLEEPRDGAGEQKYRWIAWPPDGMKGVPRVFSYTEHPNPLDDVGLGFDDQRDTGYPVSLQMSRAIAQRVTSASLDLYVAKKRGGKFERGEAVPCWVHTPDEPLLKRMEDRTVLFVIPKAHLEPNTTYLAVASLTGASARPIEWTFTTGTQAHGLGRR